MILDRRDLEKRVIVQAHGIGVDSTAVMVEWVRRRLPLHLILHADTRSEKPETVAYINVVNRFLQEHGYPEVTVVKYEVRNFKNWPPYDGLEENCLTNGTLPSLAFGFKSCSLKWKREPQDRFMRQWEPARREWAPGRRVMKLIGYDAGPRDARRRNHAGNEADPEYQYVYPLQLWGWDRERCKREIAAAGLPVPPKSSCFFCPAMKAWEVEELPVELLRRIVVLEARAKPRLEGFMSQERLDARYRELCAKWEKKAERARAAGKPEPKRPKRKTAGDPKLIRGLWYNKRMTEFIREKGLLPGDEIDRLAASAPEEIVRTQQKHAAGEPVDSWEEFFQDLGREGLPAFCGA